MSLKSKKFWVSLVALIVIIARLFGVEIDAPYVNEIIDSVCATLILLGISSPIKSGGEDKSDGEVLKDASASDDLERASDDEKSK